MSLRDGMLINSMTICAMVRFYFTCIYMLLIIVNRSEIDCNKFLICQVNQKNLREQIGEVPFHVPSSQVRR